MHFTPIVVFYDNTVDRVSRCVRYSRPSCGFLCFGLNLGKTFQDAQLFACRAGSSRCSFGWRSTTKATIETAALTRCHESRRLTCFEIVALVRQDTIPSQHVGGRLCASLKYFFAFRMLVPPGARDSHDIFTLLDMTSSLVGSQVRLISPLNRPPR